MRFRDFLLKTFSDGDFPSYGRFASFLALCCCLTWDSANLVFAWKFNHHLPLNMQPLALLPDAVTLSGQGGFCTLFYGVTKYGSIRMNKDGMEAQTEKGDK